MFRVILRGIFDVLIITVTLPIRLILSAFVLLLDVIIATLLIITKNADGLWPLFKEQAEAFLKTARKEIHWIKTGERYYLFQ